MIAARQIFLGRGAGGGLPTGYTEVDYITPASSGAYIDLGWYPTKWTVFDAHMTVAPFRRANFGVSGDASAHKPQGFSFVDVWGTDRWLGFKQNGTGEWNEDLKSYSQYNDIRNNIHHHRIDLAFYTSRNPLPTYNAYEYFVDGNVISTGFWDDETPNTKQTYNPIYGNVFLFAVNVNGNPSAAGISKMGHLKFSDEDGICADFIPCLDSDNNAGMYDLVARTFHGAASGTINYGSIV
jgi:hypothetical protein